MNETSDTVEKPPPTCKVCGVPLVLMDGGASPRPRAGNAHVYKPKRCRRCLDKRNIRGRQLARTNYSFFTPNGRFITGCFEGLLSADLDEIESWRDISPPGEPSLITKAVITDDESEELTFTLLAPSWINRSMSSSRVEKHHFPWRRVATPRPVEHPEAIKFLIHNKIAGVVWLPTVAAGLTLWRLELAPWISLYPGAEVSLLHYALSESIRRGDGGRILVRAEGNQVDMLTALGCQPTADRFQEVPKEQGIRIIMRQHGLSETIIDTLIRQDADGTADATWIAEQIGRNGNLFTAQRIEALTRLAQGFNWRDFQRIAARYGNTLTDEQRQVYEEICTVFFALKIREFWEGKQCRLITQYPQDIPAPGQVYRFLDTRSVNYVRARIVTDISPFNVYVDDEVFVISRLLFQPEHSYVRKVCEEVTTALSWSQCPHRILVVSQDFRSIGEGEQEVIMSSVVDQGAHLVILGKCKSAHVMDEVDELLKYITPKRQEAIL